VLVDHLVSRNHAMIQRTDSGEFFLIDMGSRNGSFVNECRVSTPVALRDGDKLRLGNAHMTFHDPQQAAAPASAHNVGSATLCQFMLCDVSVLVVDIRRFTVLSQQIDNAVLCELMGAWFGEADRIMRGHGSAAQKYIGDAVMAVWLHRDKDKQHVEIVNILRALSDFADVTATLGRRFGLPQDLNIGAGLNTGSAVVGNTGTNQVTDYTATGECVNAAFRLESATKSANTDFFLGRTTSDLLRRWPRADAYLHEIEVELRGYDASVRACPATFADLKRFLASVESAAG
jgi:adenylate cyclase